MSPVARSITQEGVAHDIAGDMATARVSATAHDAPVARAAAKARDVDAHNVQDVALGLTTGLLSRRLATLPTTACYK